MFQRFLNLEYWIEYNLILCSCRVACNISVIQSVLLLPHLPMKFRKLLMITMTVKYCYDSFPGKKDSLAGKSIVQQVLVVEKA